MRVREKWKIRKTDRVKKSLAEWLLKSDVPFSQRPTIKSVSRERFDLIFPQTSPELLLYVLVRNSWIEVLVAVLHEGKFYDWIVWLDIAERRRTGRFICNYDRLSGNKIFFATRQQLYADRLWEPFFKWIRENFQPGRVIDIFKTTGATWAEAKTKEDSRRAHENLVHSFPVISAGLFSCEGR